MRKNHFNRGIFLTMILMVSMTFADLIPVREGNWWQFKYTILFGRTGASNVDSGNVVWRIIPTIPGKDSTVVTIQQQRKLIHSKTTLITNPPIVFDSVFNPPRTTVDTLMLTRDTVAPAGSHMYMWNGIHINQDACIGLLHTPLCPASQCTLSMAQISYKGKALTGYIVDPLPCRLQEIANPNCIAPRKFTQLDGIGPVAFESGLAQCFIGALQHEQWTLIDHHAANRWITPDTVTSGAITTLTLATLEYACFPDSFDKNTVLSSNGITLVYKPVYNPAADCLPRYGVTTSITYQCMAPAAGKYPVFIESQPPCAPLCKMASIIECIDTLVVMEASAIKEHTKSFSQVLIPSVQSKNGVVALNNAHRYNGGEARLLDASGRLLDRASIREGKAIFKSKKYAMGKVLFVTLDNQTTLRCLIR